MLEMACLTIALASVFGGLALVGVSRDPVTEVGAWYATGMIVVGLLVSFANCLRSFLERDFICQSIRFSRWACCLPSHWRRTFFWKDWKVLKARAKSTSKLKSASRLGSPDLT